MESLSALLIRYRHLAKHFILYRLIFRGWARKTKKLRNSHQGESCFIFATGPSVSNLDLDVIEKRVQAGAKVFSVNSFISSDLSRRFPPNFVVLSDPEHLNHELAQPKFHAEIKRDQAAIAALSGFQFFVPHNWHGQIKTHPFFKNKDCAYFFNCENLQGQPNGGNILRPRHFPSMTAYVTISIALYLGFKEIYLCGFDEDYFLVTEIGIDNHVFWRDKHFYPEGSERVGRDMTVQCGLTFKKMLENAVRATTGQEKLNADAEIVGAKVWNCNPKSFVTGFPKTDQFLQKQKKS